MLHKSAADDRFGGGVRALLVVLGGPCSGGHRPTRSPPLNGQSLVNGGAKMCRRGGVKMYCGLGGSLSP